MSPHIPSSFRRILSPTLYSIALFHLSAGRIVYPFGPIEIKVGENPENLVPILLIARFLGGIGPTSDWKETLRSLKTGLTLLFSGLLIAWAANPTGSGFEDVVRLLGQAVCGWLLAEWILSQPKDRCFWITPYLAGLAFLAVRTSWGELGDPNLDGPFTHRNLQSAFYLLTLPVLLRAWTSREGWKVAGRVGAILFCGIGLAFILLSKSRAGALGVIGTGAVLVWWLSSRERKIEIKKSLPIMAGFGVFALLAMIALFPRFRDFSQEIGDPYHKSRAGVWAAAIQGWENPSDALVGIGMDDAFDKVLADTPAGNLNYRTRRAHYPHNLYFQWQYEGGITALLGWVALLLAVGGLLSRARKESDGGFAVSLTGACLLGFALSEIFESALRDQRVSTHFWLDLVLLFSLQKSSSPERLSVNENQLGTALFGLALLIPLALWPTDFSIPIALAIGATAVFAELSRRWAPSAFAPLMAILSIEFYLPGIEKLLHRDWGLPLLGVVGGVGVVLLVVRGGRRIGPSPWIAFLIPILLGFGIIAALVGSNAAPPPELIPLRGWLVIAASGVVWLALQRWFIAHPPRRSHIAVPVLLLLAILGCRLWVAHSQTFDLERLDRRIRLHALERTPPRHEWVDIAKDHPENLLPLLSKNNSPSYRWRFFARGGKVFDEGLEAKDMAVGLAVEPDLDALWVLTSSGRLVRIGDRKEDFQLDPEVVGFVHCALDIENDRLLLLEAGGRLIEVDLQDGSRWTERCPTQFGASQAIFRRLCVDPASSEVWAMDLYGRLYTEPSMEGWREDARFVPVCRRGELDVDIARDLSVTSSGTLSMLMCDGEIWSSSGESDSIKGPVRGAHYFPDFPVGQSLAWNGKGFEIVDRYGGFFHSPYPSSFSDRKFRGTYRFPRSLSMKEKRVQAGDAVVDHYYDPERRWLYTLSTRGRIRTNHRWNGIWAD